MGDNKTKKDLKHGSYTNYEVTLTPDTKDAVSLDTVSRVSSDGRQELDVDTSCGYGSCRPECLQRSNNPQSLMACLCLFALIEAYVEWGLVNVFIGTWERRYGLQSTQAAWIVTSQDVMAGVLSPIMGYIGGFMHKGRILTIGCLTMFVGCSLFIVPQFAINPYELGEDVITTTCDLSGNATSLCDGEHQNLQAWLGMFCAAQLFMGYTGAVVWTIGLAYIDENVHPNNFALCVGIMNTFSALGACFGFLAGGLLLDVYVDIGRVDMDDITITPDDPRWVGAWWIAFVIAAALSLPALLWMNCYSRELPTAAIYRKERKEEVHNGLGITELKAKVSCNCKDIGHSLKLLFCNPMFDLLTLTTIIELGGVTAFAAFLPKIIQFQFAQTSGTAALIAGGLLIPGAALGQLFGGLIPKWANLRFRGMMWQNVIAQFVCVICSFALLMRCDAPAFAGVSSGYNSSSFNESSVFNPGELVSQCNDACNCTTMSFDPICGVDGVSYFTPCYAGCISQTNVDGKAYGNCSCIPSDSLGIQAEPGMCGTDCSQFWIFLPIFFILVFATFVQSTSNQTCLMRCVPDSQRSFAFGVQGPIIRYLGNIPIPILFGFIFDQACVVWQTTCEEDGACWVYDTDQLAVGLFFAALFVKGISGLLYLIAVLVYKPKTLEDEADNHSSHSGSSSSSSSNNSSSSSSRKNGGGKQDGAMGAVAMVTAGNDDVAERYRVRVKSTPDAGVDSTVLPDYQRLISNSSLASIENGAAVPTPVADALVNEFFTSLDDADDKEGAGVFTDQSPGISITRL